MRATPKILVVEPDTALLAEMVRLLRGANYAVFSSSSACEALELADRNIPELLLLNLSTPDMPATELCYRLKSNVKLTGLLVIHIVPQISQLAGLGQGSECADCYLSPPVNDQVLLLSVRSMLRVRAAEDKMRRTEQLWRTVFSRTRNAVLLLGQDLLITDANPRAEELYEYSREELQQKHLASLSPEHEMANMEARLRLVFQGHAIVLHTEQQKKNGDIFAAEIQARHFRVGDASYLEMMVWNLDEDSRVEIDSREMDREIDLLSDYHSSKTDSSVTAALYAGGPLSQRLPSTFQELLTQYWLAIKTRLDNKAYKLRADSAVELKSLAELMGSARAGPRDLVELHTTVLRKQLQGENSRKKAAYQDEGRFILLELMGYLASYYRDRSFGSHGARSGE